MRIIHNLTTCVRAEAHRPHTDALQARTRTHTRSYAHVRNMLSVPRSVTMDDASSINHDFDALFNPNKSPAAT